MSHATITQSGALLNTHRQSGRRDHTRRGKRVGARSAKQVQGNVGAAELNLTDEEIAEIEGRNAYQPELVMAV